MRSRKYETLKTVYAEGIDKLCPLSEYPRPSLRRDSYLCLNGEWDFSVTKKGETPKGYGERILVPFPHESLLSGLEGSHTPGEVLNYKRSFSLPEGFQRARTILHFGAVDQIATVYLNGRELMTHEGGYLPFSIDITDALFEGVNVLSVTVSDDLDLMLPYGKQTKKRGGMWYTPASGIWQTVWIESVPENYIEKIRITPSQNSVTLTVFGGTENKRLTLTESGECFDFSGNEITFSPKTIKNWTPEEPYLYEFTLESGEDRIESYFALRTVDIREICGVRRICLNGKPYLFNGLLDQGYFPDGIFTPASYKAYEDDIRLAKSLGFNMLRKHIKTEPEIFYYLCDRLGIAVFQDMVNNFEYSFIRDTALPTIGLKRLSDKNLHKNERGRRIFREQMKKTFDHLYNFPSIVYYTVFNEGWGQFLADENYGLAKELDKTRVIDATSGWFWQKESDVDSYHIYFKKAKIEDFSSRAVVLSEFGGYSCRIEGHLFGKENYGYSMCKTEGEFEKALIKLYREEIIPLARRGISSLVYTQISDIEDETNGFITYDRKHLKVNPENVLSVMRELYCASSEKSASVTE